MNIRLTPSDPRPIYVQIVDEIRRAVVLGILGSDDPLPSVRQLAGELRVNPNTVQQAYRELEREDVVYVKRGQGTFVANTDTPVTERGRMIEEVAERALRDAFRHGIAPEELVEAIRARRGRAEGGGPDRANEPASAEEKAVAPAPSEETTAPAPSEEATRRDTSDEPEEPEE